MKIIAYYILHYGIEWLSWSVGSVVKHVDEIHLFYTPTPSHGHGTNTLCPETRMQLLNTVETLNKVYGKLFWHDTKGFPHEGLQRHNAVDTCVANGADIVLVVDADELWDSDVLERALSYAVSDTMHREYRIGMRHFWRSLQWVCDDQAMPTRIIKPTSGTTPQITGYMGDAIGKVFHMGYAQSPRIIEYKQSIHGHKAEWRKNWFCEKFMPWSPENPFGDVHPTNEDYWYPKPINIETPQTTTYMLSKLCGDHPYMYTGLITNGSF